MAPLQQKRSVYEIVKHQFIVLTVGLHKRFSPVKKVVYFSPKLCYTNSDGAGMGRPGPILGADAPDRTSPRPCGREHTLRALFREKAIQGLSLRQSGRPLFMGIFRTALTRQSLGRFSHT